MTDEAWFHQSDASTWGNIQGNEGFPRIFVVKFMFHYDTGGYAIAFIQFTVECTPLAKGETFYVFKTAMPCMSVLLGIT